MGYLFEEKPFEVRKVSAWLPISQELLDDKVSFADMYAAAVEADKAFRALPPEEQARINAKKKAAYESERCAACGCHPQEHGE